MENPSTWRYRPLVLSLLLTAMLVGCAPSAEPIPPGAQQVHVVITGSEIRLTPAAVQAGDVYLVLDAPEDGSFVFVQRKTSPEATPGPMTDDDVARLADGDFLHTAMEGIDAGGCDPQQNADARGKLGYCGNVYRVTLIEGKYVLAADMADSPGTPLTKMAVLEVMP